MGIDGVCFPKLGAHPLLLHAELEPEHEEDKDESDKSAHLGEGDRGAKEPGQNAGVDGVTDDCIGPGGDQLVALLNRDGAEDLQALRATWPKNQTRCWKLSSRENERKLDTR